METEAVRRNKEMTEHWAGMGHRESACSGHTHPLPDCPAPQVHARVFPRSPELLRSGALNDWADRYGPDPLTDIEADLFMQGRVAAWREAGRPGLLSEYLGMTGAEYSRWVASGTVSRRVRRVWGLG